MSAPLQPDTFLNGRVQLLRGDCMDVLPTLAENSVDSVVTDPPYHLTSIVKRFGKVGAAPAQFGTDGAFARASRGFMGQQWDGGDIAFRPELWAEVLRVLKPGGHLLAFGGARTYHRLACAVEDAGFEIREQIMWLYGSGFSKVGMLKNRCSEQWCSCDGEEATEYNLRELRRSDLPAAEYNGRERENAVLSRMSQSDLSQRRPEGAEPELGGREQSSMEGRTLSRARERLCDGAQSLASTSKGERLRSGTHLGRGTNAGPTAHARGGGSSQEPGSGGQPAGEPSGLRQPFGTLDGGALRGRGACPRCGGISRSFDGFGGSLKPAHEPLVLARKPLSESSVAANVLKWGTGAINVDGCRVSVADHERDVIDNRSGRGFGSIQCAHAGRAEGLFKSHEGGRWPANVILSDDEEVAAAFEAFGERRSGGYPPAGSPRSRGSTYGQPNVRGARRFTESEGTAARFFYTAKADDLSRQGSKHPTVKPLDLIQYLVRLITPPGGTVLDCFAGTGTTGEGAFREGMRAVLVEREPEYQQDIAKRMALVMAGPDEKRRAIIKRKGKVEAAGPLFAGWEAAE